MWFLIPLLLNIFWAANKSTKNRKYDKCEMFVLEKARDCGSRAEPFLVLNIRSLA
jgi:hypothetical protein